MKCHIMQHFVWVFTVCQHLQSSKTPDLKPEDQDEPVKGFLVQKGLNKAENRLRGYKTFFMHNSAEHRIYPAHKCKNANNCWYFNIISMMNTTSEKLKARNFFICWYLSFYEQL